MTSSLPRVTAGVLMFIVGSLVGLTAIGIVAARLVIAAGLPAAAGHPVTAADMAMLSDLVAISPFIALFGLVNILASVGLFIESTWARPLARATAVAGVVLGVTGVTLLVLGHDPFAKVPSDRALDGIEMIGAFTVSCIAAAVALAVDGTKRRARPAMTAAA